MKQKSNKNGFTGCVRAYIRNLQEEGRYSTAHVYKDTILSLTRFYGTPSITFGQTTRDSLRRYGQYLHEHGLKPNTVPIYMRMLRSIYNRGVETGVARLIPRLFRDVCTGIGVRQKKVPPVSELHTPLYKAPQSQHLIRTQAIVRLMFQFCGMPFSDFAHLEKSALEDGIFRYNRIKTGTTISLEILDTSKEEINKLRNSNPPRENCPDHLFSIMRGDKRRKEEGIYKEYQSALCRSNNQLESLPRELSLRSPVSLYTVRHSQATNAKYQGILIEMTSESLGYKSMKAAQTYLKGSGLKKRTEANQLNCLYVESYNTSYQ